MKNQNSSTNQNIRKKFLQPQRFEDERYETLLQTELHSLSHAEQAHLEQEFVDYERLYPHELRSSLYASQKSLKVGWVER